MYKFFNQFENEFDFFGNFDIFGRSGFWAYPELTIDSDLQEPIYTVDKPTYAVINGTPSSETLTGTNSDDVINGNGGVDKFYGLGGDDIYNGGSSHDRFYASQGNDIAYGNDGNDTFIYWGIDNPVLDAETFYGGNGYDRLWISSFPQNVTAFTLDARPDANGFGTGSFGLKYKEVEVFRVSLSGSTDTIWTLGGDDEIRVGLGNDFVNAGGGNDKITGSFGDDIIYGGAGNDIIDGDQSGAWDTGNENDTIYGGDGDDSINGNVGNDWIDGGNDTDLIYGGDGQDIIFGGAGDDILDGGAGDDSLDGGIGIDTASYSGATLGVTVDLSITVAQNTHGGGVDTLIDIENVNGSGFTDTLTGDDGDNRLSGNAGNDTLNGLDGNDTLNGNAGADILNGGAGDDIIITGLGWDTVDGGAGVDTVDYTNSTNTQTINLITNVNIGGFAHHDNLTNIENVLGSDTRRDNITGNAEDNVLDGQGASDRLRGHDGNDTLLGGAGNDFLYGGNGADTLDGGVGNDWVMYNGLTTGVIVNLLTGIGSGGQAEGDTYISIERIRGSAVDDVLIGDNNNNKILGDNGNDTINGNGGKDIIRGGGGNDTINGGSGNDSLRGDAGNDTFVFGTGGGADWIADFTQGDDVIDILGSSFTSFADILATSVDSGANTFIIMGGGDIIKIAGTNKAALTSADFLLDGVVSAEAPTIDKAVIAEGSNVIDKPIITDDIGTVDKPVVSDDDSFVFTQKPVVSDVGDYVLGDTGITPQDLLAEFLAQAQQHHQTHINAFGVLEIDADSDADLGLFTDYFEIV